MKLIVRVDASAAIGGGHVMRCRALAEALIARGWSAAFASRAENINAVRALAGTIPVMGLDVDAGAETAELARLAPDGCDVLLVDHYDRGIEFEGDCRGWAKRIVALDDFPNRPHDCDILVDQTAGRRSRSYEAMVPSDARIATGAMYAMLRPQFAQARWALAGHTTSRSVANDKPTRILVALGATDPDNVTTDVVRALDTISRDLEIDIALSGAAPHLDTVRNAIVDCRHETRLHVDVADMASLMTSADLAVGAAGGSAWERCCLGLPTVMIQIADNQRDIVEGLVELGAADTASANVDSIAATISCLLDDPSRHAAMQQAAMSVCDGLGADRLALMLVPSIMALDGHPVTLAPVEVNDARTLHAWQSNPETRRHARNPAVPTMAEHLAWFDTRRTDPGCIFNMVMHLGTPAGVVRLDRRADRVGFEVSIVTAPHKRGKGIAAGALTLVRALLPGERLLAYIGDENEASLKLFAAAGYTSLGEGWYENRPDGAGQTV